MVWADSLPIINDSDKAVIAKSFVYSYYHNINAIEFGKDFQGKAKVNQDYIKTIKKSCSARFQY